MNFDMAAVKRHLRGRIRVAGDSGEYVLPDAALAPTRKAIVDCLVRPVLARTILPAATNPHHVHDTAQYPTIIVPLGAALIDWQMRLDFRPLLIAEPEQSPIHRWPPESVDQHLESTHG
jgi:hypothetical protein